MQSGNNIELPSQINKVENKRKRVLSDNSNKQNRGLFPHLPDIGLSKKTDKYGYEQRPAKRFMGDSEPKPDSRLYDGNMWFYDNNDLFLNLNQGNRIADKFTHFPGTQPNKQVGLAQAHRASPPMYSNTGYMERPTRDGLVGEEYEGGTTFPSYFNPRSAENMPCQEKVVNWMNNVLIYQIAENVWETDCYSIDEYTNFEEEEFDEAQERINYNVQDLSYVCSLATPDEIIEFQCKRWSALVKKTYESDR
ncbi:hypothetical protein ACO0QE_001666 [Hanseniaspora vineae]